MNKNENSQPFSTIDHAMEAVLFTDEHLVVQYVNHALLELTGYQRHEVVGKGLDALHADKDRLREVIIKTKLGEAWAGQMTNVAKNGTFIRKACTIFPMINRQGGKLGYVCIWKDVAQLSTLRRQLLQAQKMKAVGTLAAGVAHDFNTLLGPIILHAELGLEVAEHDTQLCHSLAQILEAAKRARGLAEQLLNLSRKHELDAPIPFRLRSVLEECVKLLRPGLPASVRITQNIATDLDVVLSDPTHIHQLIMNLIINAAEAMHERGGEIKIEIRLQELDELTCKDYPQARPGSYVLLRVSDTGPGMNAETMDKIFDPFFTTKNNEKCIGLGLAVVQNVMSLLKGAIKVQGRPGQGSTFDILIPKAKMPESLQSEDNSGLGARRGERILLVGDYPALSNPVQLVLERLGYEVEAAQSGMKALEQVRERPGAFHLVIADVTMPGLSGLALARDLRRSAPGLRIMLSSNDDDRLDSQKLQKAGVADWIKKPCQMDELGRKVRNVLDRELPA